MYRYAVRFIIVISTICCDFVSAVSSRRVATYVSNYRLGSFKDKILIWIA